MSPLHECFTQETFAFNIVAAAGRKRNYCTPSRFRVL